jgi:hypothetical protein
MMATFDELEAEVGKLRRKVRQLEGGNAGANNRRAVDDIVSEADGDERLIASGGGGFSAACSQSRQSLIEKQKLSAQRELRNNPGCIKTPAALHSFRGTYIAVPTDELDDIIREFSK